MIADRCLRTTFIWPMSAPEAKSALLTACLSSSVRPSAGNESSAEPPPEIRHKTRSSGPASRASARMRWAALLPASSGTGCAASTISIRSARHGVAVTGDDQPFQRPRPVVLHGLRHGGTRLAGPEDDRPALGRRRQVRRDDPRRQGRGDRGIEHGPQEAPRRVTTGPPPRSGRRPRAGRSAGGWSCRRSGTACRWRWPRCRPACRSPAPSSSR